MFGRMDTCHRGQAASSSRRTAARPSLPVKPYERIAKRKPGSTRKRLLPVIVPLPLYREFGPSIFAEYLMKKFAKGRFEAYSAGRQPTGTVNPFAIRVLREEYDIDARDARRQVVG